MEMLRSETNIYMLGYVMSFNKPVKQLTYAIFDEKIAGTCHFCLIAIAIIVLLVIGIVVKLEWLDILGF